VRHFYLVLQAGFMAGAILWAGWHPRAIADEVGETSHGRRGPVYQRHAFGSGPMQYGYQHDRRGHGNDRPADVAQVNAGWFQRPYPYHLDYYRMRYGGSYAPYFGNLYGPPQVVTAPPYYGPYYGGYGNGYPYGYDSVGGYGPRPDCCPCEPVGESGRAEEQQNGRGAVE
jgi:hypothetical protein